MIKKIGIIINLTLFTIFPSIVWSYHWPIKPFAGPHSIFGTLGEYRPGHLHGGVDVGCAVGTAIFPIDTGLAYRIGQGYDAGVSVGSNEYIHLYVTS